MSDQPMQITATNLLDSLSKQELITSQSGLEKFILEQQKDPEIPFYLKVLSGIGAFIACICFIGFLAAAEIISFNDELQALIWGLLFIAAAIGLYKGAGEDNSVRQSFFIQASFALIATGKLLFVFAIGEWLDGDGWGINLACLVIAAATYPFYRLNVERFLSACVVLIAILLNILWNNNLGLSKELLFNAFLLIQLAGASLLLVHPRVPQTLQPVAQAFIIGLCASVLFLFIHAEFYYFFDYSDVISPLFANILLSATMITLIVWAVGGRENLRKEPIIIAIIGCLLLGLLSAPGIMLAIGLMVFGYARHDRLFTLLGALLLPVFLWLYYYNLDITLLQKSIILLCSGIVLLAGKLYLKLKGWDRGPDAEQENTSGGETTCA